MSQSPENGSRSCKQHPDGSPVVPRELLRSIVKALADSGYGPWVCPFEAGNLFLYRGGAIPSLEEMEQAVREALGGP